MSLPACTLLTQPSPSTIISFEDSSLTSLRGAERILEALHRTSNVTQELKELRLGENRLGVGDEGLGRLARGLREMGPFRNPLLVDLSKLVAVILIILE